MGPHSIHILTRAVLILAGGNNATLASFRDLRDLPLLRPALDEATRIITVAISLTRDEQSTFGGPETVNDSGWPWTEGPFLTLLECLNHEHPSRDMKLAEVFAAVALWALHRMRRSADEGLAANGYLLEAALLIAEAEYWNGRTAQSKESGALGLDKRYAGVRGDKRNAYLNIWRNKSPKCTQQEIAQLISVRLPNTTIEQGLRWIRQWRMRELRGLPGMDVED